MSFITSIGIMIVLGIGFSVVSFGSENIRKSRIFHFAGLAIFIAMLAYACSRISISSQAGAFVTILALAVTGIVWGPFFAYWGAEFISSVARSAIGLNDIRVPPAYGPAEGALARRDYEEAERLFRELIDEYPDEAQPCSRLGELLLSRNRLQEALACFKEAENREPDVGVKLIHRLSAADILADCLNDPQGAISMLQEFADSCPEGEAREYAEERIKVLRARVRGSTEKSR